MLRRKRITDPDGLWDPFEPLPLPVKLKPPRERRITAARVGRVAVELARSRQLKHLPTLGQLRLMAQFDGRQPSTYRLDRAENWLPEVLPYGFPEGSDGLRFTHREGAIVVAPDGLGFGLD
jgi:hypothetical protein